MKADTLNILVPLDFDARGDVLPACDRACRQALLEARRGRVGITFLHVVDKPVLDDDLTRLQPQSRFKARVALVQEKLEQLVADAAAHGADADCRVATGTPWRAIIECVDAGGFDLVIAGTRSKNVLGRAMFGKVANRLLRYCPCPVWTVGPRGGSDMRTILVAHDLTETGSLALRAGSRLAHAHGAGLEVLHVLELPESERFLGSISEPALARRMAMAHDLITRECSALGHASDVGIHVVEGTAHTHILDFLGHHDVDLLCMGSVARSGLAGMITGNTAENVFPWIACSLLVVKPASFRNALKPAAGVADPVPGKVEYS